MEGKKKYNSKIRKKFIHYTVSIGLLFCLIPFLQGKDAKIDSLKQVLAIANTDSMRYLLCRQIGDAYYEGNFDSLLVYYDKSLILAQQLDNTREQISTLRSFAYVYRYKKNDYTKAKGYFQKTYDLTVAKKDTLAKAYILNDLGELYRAKGANLQAVDYLFQANKTAESLQHKHLLTRTWHSIGQIYNEQKEHDKALKYFQQALPFTENDKFKRMRGTLLNSIGETYQHLQQYNQAQTSFDAASLLFQQIEDNDQQTDVYYNMAQNALATNDYDYAIAHFKKALSLNKIIDNQNRATKILAGLATTYLKNKNFKQAEATALKGLAIIEKIDTRLHIHELNDILAQVYVQQKNYAKAFFHQQQGIAAKDSLQLEAASKKLSQMTLLYEQEKKTAEIEQLRANNAEQNLSLNRTRFTTYLMGLLSLLLITLAFLWQYYQRLQHLSQYKALRIQLTHDLHDNVSSSLSQIKMMVNRLTNPRFTPDQKKKNIQIIKSTSNEVVNNMHDLIWGLDDSKETIGDLIIKMQDHASQYLTTSGLKYKIKQQISNKQKSVKADFKNNVYAIFKEAIHNVVKHAQPEKVFISFVLEGNFFSMDIKNDTYQLKEITHSSNIGMKSIKKRAEAISGKVLIKEEDNFFIVKLEVTI